MILTLTIKYLVSWHCGFCICKNDNILFSWSLLLTVVAATNSWIEPMSKLTTNIWFIISSLKYINQYLCSKVESLFSSWLFIKPLTFNRKVSFFALCYRKDNYVIEVTHFPCYLPRRLPRLKLCQAHHIVNQINLEFATMTCYINMHSFFIVD